MSTVECDTTRKCNNCFIGKRRKECAEYRCTDSPVIMGLCQRHHDELEAKERRYRTAVHALHTGIIDSDSMRPGPLRDEFWRLREWWFRVCAAATTRRRDPVLRDEIEYATSWCVSIAQEIIDAERELRAGTGGDDRTRQYIRQQFWECFDNLERGLMSNGVERLEGRR